VRSSEAHRPGRRAGGFAALGVALSLASAAPGDPPPRIDFRVTVSQVSSEPGEIDPKGRQLHGFLSRDFRYESLRVLETRTLSLGIDDIGSMQLPTGKRVRLRPLDVGAKGVLVAVDVQGSTRMDLRVPNHKVVVIGGQPYGGGRLVITLQPEY
jgi:hypothetical protein